MEEITNGSIGKTIVILVVMLLLGWMPVTAQQSVNYAVVVKNSTYQDPAWEVVVDTLLERYNGLAFTYETSVWEVQTGLSGYHPSHVCFVAKPLDAPASFVETVHQLMRALDGDPYGDAVWGVITGYDAEDALRIASGPSSMTISNVILNDCDGLLNYVYEGIYFACHIYNHMRVKYPDGHIDTLYGPTDCIDTLVSLLNTNEIDLFMTAGHGNHNEWQRHFPDAGLEGYFRSSAGQLYGDPAGEARLHPIMDPFYSQEFIVNPGAGDIDTVTFRITINWEGHPWNYGGNPAFGFPSFDIDDPQIINTNAHNAVITDNFVLLNIWNQGDPDLQPGDTREVIFTAQITGVEKKPIAQTPKPFRLVQCYPNPFESKTRISYTVAKESRVNLMIYNISGQKIKTLVNRKQEPGYYEITWDARDDKGSKAPVGIYFVRLEVEGFKKVRKVILMR